MESPAIMTDTMTDTEPPIPGAVEEAQPNAQSKVTHCESGLKNTVVHPYVCMSGFIPPAIYKVKQ